MPQIRYYVYEAGEPLTGPTLSSDELVIDEWRAASDGLNLKGLPIFSYLIWWLFSRVGVFAQSSAGALILRNDGEIVFRALVTPKWYRFAAMGTRDLQIGDVWTRPDWRGRGLAKCAIGAIASRWRGEYERLWYIVDDDNAASIRVIEACGFALAGYGIRTALLGVGAFGRFRLTERLHRSD